MYEEKPPLEDTDRDEEWEKRKIPLSIKPDSPKYERKIDLYLYDNFKDEYNDLRTYIEEFKMLWQDVADVEYWNLPKIEKDKIDLGLSENKKEMIRLREEKKKKKEIFDSHIHKYLLAKRYNQKTNIKNRMQQLKEEFGRLVKPGVTNYGILYYYNYYISEVKKQIKETNKLLHKISSDIDRYQRRKKRNKKNRINKEGLNKKRRRETHEHENEEKETEDVNMEEGEITERPLKKQRGENMRCKVCGIKSKFVDPYLEAVLCKNSDCQSKLYMEIRSYINQLKFKN
jgi:hypothetical protein